MIRRTTARALPDGWQAVRLGDVADLNQGLWDPSDGSSILYLDLTSVVEPGKLSAPIELTAESAPSRARRRVQAGDILVSTVRPYLRGFARVREVPKNLIASTGFAVLTPQAVTDGSLLYHHVMSPSFARHLEANMTGQAYPAVRPDDVAAYRLGLPPLAEQRAIAAVLDAIDEAIERTEEVIAATERLRDALLHELLTRGPPGRHSKRVDVPGLGTVPACWDVVRLDDILVVDQPGAWGDDPTLDNAGVRVLRAADLTRDGRVDPKSAAWRSLSERDLERRLMKDGDLILERSGGGPGTPVGRVAMIRGFGPVYCNNFCQQLRVDDTRCSPRYVLRALWHRYVRGITSRLEHQTTGIRNLDYAAYLAWPTPLPTLDEQLAIADALDGVEAAIERAREERARLHSLQTSAADALLTGRVRVGIPGHVL